MDKSYVYFMHAVGTDFYKIGWTSTNLSTRLANIQICCPFEVKIVCLIETDDPTGTEKIFHDKYESCRSRGEWFELKLIGIESLYYLGRSGLILNPNTIADLLTQERKKVNHKLTNRRRKKQGKPELKLVKECLNPKCRKLLAGKQRNYCSDACKQLIYRQRNKAA